MAFECRLLGVVRLSIFGRFVFLESAISGRFVWDFSEIWICGLYLAEVFTCIISLYYLIIPYRNLRLLSITDTELNAIAALAHMGDNNIPTG